jgi:hypothetical protein
MPPKLRAATHGGAVVLMSALVFSACLVQDVELVDQLPGGGGAAATGGKASSAGSPSASGSQNEGGGEEPGAAGRDAGGNDAGGSAGSASGGATQGGSAGSGMSGSPSMGGTGTGSPSAIPPGLLSCSDVVAYVCDNFEDQLSSQWPPGTAPADIADAPSGNQGLVVDYAETYALPVDLTAMSISFWVRFPSPTDQRFLSFQDATTLQEFGIGIEHERARWIHPDMAAPAVVPEQNTLTRVLDVDTWVCVQLRVDLLTHTFDASVVVPGDGPVALPVLDKDPTPGQDELWNTSFPDWTANGGVLVFSEAGVYQEFDDVLVGDYDAETLCERFVAFDAN